MQSETQTLNCKVGNWRAQARVQEVEAGKLMAVISVTDESGRIAADSKHTVVFDHTAGMNTLEETEELVQKLLYARYGII
jgi:hypothetical protein